jgi:hypothetical protein
MWCRLGPGAEVFSVLFLARNTLVVLCPLLPSSAGKAKMAIESSLIYPLKMLIFHSYVSLNPDKQQKTSNNLESLLRG